ncbi:MAG: hypothetical protein ACRC9V_08065, partial [Aeromonas sp.]
MPGGGIKKCHKNILIGLLFFNRMAVVRKSTKKKVIQNITLIIIQGKQKGIHATHSTADHELKQGWEPWSCRVYL